MKRIIPRFDARFFEVEFVTEEKPQETIKSENPIAIDHGLDNKCNLCLKYWVIVYFRR